MQPTQNTDYKQLITELIKKQIVVLGPFITLAKARNVKGLTIDDEGNVTSMTGRPQEVIQELVDQFVQLSGLIVKKTMEPLLAGYPDGITQPFTTPQEPTVPPTPQVNANTEVSPQPPSGEAGSGSARQTSPPQPTTETTQTTEPNQQTET